MSTPRSSSRTSRRGRRRCATPTRRRSSAPAAPLPAADARRPAAGVARPADGGPPPCAPSTASTATRAAWSCFAHRRGGAPPRARQFRLHTVGRGYLAWFTAVPKPGRIKSRLVDDRGDGRRGSTDRPGEGQRAVTHVAVLEDLGDFALVECRLETGARIRCASIWASWGRRCAASRLRPSVLTAAAAGRERRRGGRACTRRAWRRSPGGRVAHGMVGAVAEGHGRSAEALTPLPLARFALGCSGSRQLSAGAAPDSLASFPYTPEQTAVAGGRKTTSEKGQPDARRPTTPPLLDPQFLARLEQLELVSRKIFLGRMKGERRSKRKGQSVEFADYRNYVIGDDLRFLDWNLYARLDRLFIRLFMEEEDLHFYVLHRQQPVDGLRHADQAALRQAGRGGPRLHRPGQPGPRRRRGVQRPADADACRPCAAGAACGGCSTSCRSSSRPARAT